jgi:hypothetical protein
MCILCDLEEAGEIKASTMAALADPRATTSLALAVIYLMQKNHIDEFTFDVAADVDAKAMPLFRVERDGTMLTVARATPEELRANVAAARGRVH